MRVNLTIKKRNNDKYSVVARFKIDGKMKERAIDSDMTRDRALLQLEKMRKKLPELEKDFITELKKMQKDNLDNKRSILRYVENNPKSLCNGVKKRTEIKYWGTFYKHIVPFFGEKKMNLISRKDVEQFFNEKEDEGMSLETLNGFKTILKNIFNHAIMNGYMTIDFTKNLKFTTKVNKKIIQWLEIDELKQLLEIVKDDVVTLLQFQLASMLGLRASEVLGLTKSSFEGDTVIINKQTVRVPKEGVILQDTTKNATARTLALPESIKKNVEKCFAITEEKIQKLGLTYDDMPLFVTRRGGLYGQDHLSLKMKRVVEENNFKKITYHGLRHTCVMICIENNMRETDIAFLMGHTIETFRNNYAHVRSEGKNEMAGIMNSIM